MTRTLAAVTTPTYAGHCPDSLVGTAHAETFTSRADIHGLCFMDEHDVHSFPVCRTQPKKQSSEHTQSCPSWVLEQGPSENTETWSGFNSTNNTAQLLLQRTVIIQAQVPRPRSQKNREPPPFTGESVIWDRQCRRTWRYKGEMLLHKAPQAQEYLPSQN